jgi:hypothetical protein
MHADRRRAGCRPAKRSILRHLGRRVESLGGRVGIVEGE